MKEKKQFKGNRKPNPKQVKRVKTFCFFFFFYRCCFSICPVKKGEMLHDAGQRFNVENSGMNAISIYLHLKKVYLAYVIDLPSVSFFV